MYLTREEWLKQNAVGNEKENNILARCYDTIMSNVSTKEGTPWSPLRGIYPGNGFSGIWNWDTAFHAMCVSRWDTVLAEESILAFMRFQEYDGKLPDVILNDGEIASISSKPPVMATYVLLTYERGGNMEFLSECYDRLIRNEMFWQKNRMSDGLFYYDAETADPEERDLYARYESGWDDSVRWDADICSLYPIDLQCYMVMTYRALASIANILGKSDTEWKLKEIKLTDLINNLFYDEEKGIYTDIFKKDKSYSRIYSPASFTPLYIGIASKKRAEYMADFANDKNIYAGSMDYPLSSLGMKQAELCGEKFKNIKIDAIYSSNLRRAYDTAACVSKATGIEIVVDNNLRECDGGDWEGFTYDKLYELYPEEYGIWIDDIGNAVCPKGESVKAFADRIINTVTKIAESNEDKTVCIFTHATPIRVLTAVAKQIPIDELSKVEWSSNASINTFEYINGRFLIVELNNDAYLGSFKSQLPPNA